jgi:CBS domain containing-hemolysin-like protein
MHLPYAIVLLLCLLLVGLFAASEAALAATNRVRLRHLLRRQSGDEPGAAQYLSEELSGDAQNFIATVTIAANVPLVAAAALALWMGSDLDGPRGAVVASAVTAVVTVVFFQIAPRLVVSQPGALEKLWWVGPARLLMALLHPLVSVLLWLGRLMLLPTGLMEAAKPPSEAESTDEIRDLVQTAGGTVPDESRELIESIFTFGDTRVHEVMIPRPDIVALSWNCTPLEAMKTFEESGLSRVPLHEGSVDQVAGILHVKDVLAALAGGDLEFSPKALMREPLYLPESQKIDEALASMRAKKTHLAIVMDEFGGTAGLLTVEDILEELVGDIADEHDVKEEAAFATLDEHTALVDARLHADDLKDAWDLTLPVAEFDTVGGFVIERLGRAPVVGDRVELPGAVLEVFSMRGRRPRKIKILRRVDGEAANKSAAGSV